MAALTFDDDGGTYETSASRGHEVYVLGPGQAWLLLVPGDAGQCGRCRSWHTHPDYCAVDGDLSFNASAVTGLPQTATIPGDVRLNIQTGGGVVLGREERTFLGR